mmetsp:Transcript_4024/g.6029  ORF Transcript_4024/g.6029 Transcript_4024/m.6029 type:complete len:97 (-) Transcript_4024:160-450(-)
MLLSRGKRAAVFDVIDDGVMEVNAYEVVAIDARSDNKAKFLTPLLLLAPPLLLFMQVIFIFLEQGQAVTCVRLNFYILSPPSFFPLSNCRLQSDPS